MKSAEIPLDEAALMELMNQLEESLQQEKAVAPEVPAATEQVAPPWEGESVIETPEPEVAPSIESAPVEKSVAKPSRAYRGQVQATATGLRHFIDVAAFQDDIHIDETNMDEAMMTQAGMRAFYGAQAAYAEAQASREKAKFEIFEAKLNDLHRKDLAAKGEKVTEAMVSSAVKSDPRWLAAKERVIDSETIAQINKGLVSSLADRRDMLIQLGSDRREEFKGQLRIVGAEAQKQMTAERAKEIAAGIAARRSEIPA